MNKKEFIISHRSDYNIYKESIDNKQMTNVIAIIVPIVLSVLFIAVSFYLYTVFCHPQDSGLGDSLWAKLIVITAQSLAWAQLLLVILDLSITDTVSINIIYEIVFVAIYLLTVFALPLFSGLYEADEDDSKCKQFLKAFIQAFVISVVWSAVTFISYIWLSKYTDRSGVNRQISLPFYMYLVQALVGWVLLAINGALGLVFFPYDLITGFFSRPKRISKKQAIELKKQLQNRSDELIQEGQKLKIQDEEFQAKSSQMNFFSRRKRQGQLKDLISKYRTEINTLQSDYQRFNVHLTRAAQNPIIPFLKLIGGIISALISILWVIQLFGTTVYVNGSPAFRLLDAPFSDLNQGNGGFIASIFYGVLVVYMLICLIKGNVIFGIKIPYVLAIHPLQANKTYLNSLVFNSSIMLISSLSISEMGMIAFPEYLRVSYLGAFYFNEVRYLDVFGFLFRDRIYTIVFLSMVGLSLLYLGIKICRERRREKRSSEAKDK